MRLHTKGAEQQYQTENDTHTEWWKHAVQTASGSRLLSVSELFESGMLM